MPALIGGGSRDTACRLFRTAHSGIGTEIEFAVLEFADLRQAIAQRVEARRLGLELAELLRKRIEVALGVLVDACERFALTCDAGAQIGDLVQAARGRAGEEEGRSESGAEKRERRPARMPAAISRPRGESRSMRVGTACAFPTIMMFII